MRLENNLGGDNLYGNFRLYIEGIEVPFSAASVTNTYRGLPTAQITLAPWRGFSEITKGYFPKVHLFYRDFNQGLAPYDIKRMAAGIASTNVTTAAAAMGESAETYNKLERHAYKLIFGGVITSVTDSKSLAGDGGSASISLNCVHPYYILNEILFKYIGTNPQETNARDSAFGIMVDGGNVGSMYTIEQALAGVRAPGAGQKTLEDGGGDTSVLSDTMSDNYWRLQGIPGVIVALWNSFKRSAYSTGNQKDKSIMTKMYIPLMESGLKYFTKMTGHPVIEGSIQRDSKTAPTQAPTTTQTAAKGSPEAVLGLSTMSDRGKKELIEFAEGRHYKLYDDATGKTIAHAVDAVGTPSIGVGHAVAKTDTQFDGKTLSDAQVNNLLSDDVSNAERAVSRLGLKLSQGQFDALVDLTFNVGPGGPGKDGALQQSNGQPSTLVRLITEGNTQGAANEFMSWVYAGGQVSQGLVTRRKRDQAFFLDSPLPSAQSLAANAYSSRGSNEEMASNNGKLIPGNMNGLLPAAMATQLLSILSNSMTSGGTGEVMSYGQLIDAFLEVVEYDHVILNSPAKIGIAGIPEIVDHVYKPRMFAYYSPICNVLLPNMYEAYSVNIGTDQVPSRVIYNGMQFTADSQANYGTSVNLHNYVSPHSVRKALADGGNLKGTLASLVATPGKYEWGSGVRTADGTLPYWYAVLSNQTPSANVGDLASGTTLDNLKAAWNKLYPEDPTLNPWDTDLSGIEAYQRLFFTGVDVEFSNIYSQARQGSVEGVFNPFIVPGYPMDIIDPSPLRESYHGFCTSVTHSFDAAGYSATSIGMSSAYTFSEIATCYIPGTYPWLLAQLKMDENLSMYGNTPAFQRACQYYNDVLGVGAADPTILEAYSTGKPFPLKRNMGVWEIGESATLQGSDHPTLYTTTLGNLNLVARNIASLLDIEKEHAMVAETFVDIDMWNQGSPTVEEVRKGPWVNDQSGTQDSSTLRGRDMEASAFLDYDSEAETPDPVIVAGDRPTNVPPTVGQSGLPLQQATVQGQLPDVLPKLGKRCSVGALDAESQAKLAECHPDLVKVVMKVIETRPVVITSGYRTSAKQAALENGGGQYAQGAGKGSRHLKYPSWAIDMVPCNNLNASSRAVMENFATYVLQCANSMGVTLRWGGNFSTYDPVHFDLGLG
jgi:Phage-related lysozyme (muraminidase)